MTKIEVDFKHFKNNFSRSYFDPKYIFGVSSVRIGSVVKTIELATDMFLKKLFFELKVPQNGYALSKTQNRFLFDYYI